MGGGTIAWFLLIYQATAVVGACSVFLTFFCAADTLTMVLELPARSTGAAVRLATPCADNMVLVGRALDERLQEKVSPAGMGGAQLIPCKTKNKLVASD